MNLERGKIRMNRRFPLTFLSFPKIQKYRNTDADEALTVLICNSSIYGYA